MSTQDDEREWVRSLGLFWVIIADLIGCTGAGLGIGYLAFRKWGAPWWVLLITTLAGLGLAMYRLNIMAQSPKAK